MCTILYWIMVNCKKIPATTRLGPQVCIIDPKNLGLSWSSSRLNEFLLTIVDGGVCDPRFKHGRTGSQCQFWGFYFSSCVLILDPSHLTWAQNSCFSIFASLSVSYIILPTFDRHAIRLSDLQGKFLGNTHEKQRNGANGITCLF